MKKILYHTDFSDQSVEGLKYALHFAYFQRVHLVVLHTYNKDNEISLTQLEERLSTFISSNKKDLYQNVSIETLVKASTSVVAILEITASTSIDLIILPINTPDSTKSDFIDKNSLAIIKHAICPVLLIPKDIPFNGISTIVLSEDFELGDLKTLKYIKEVGVQLRAEVYCLHVMETEEKNVRVWNNIFDFEGLFRGKNIYFDAVKGGIPEELLDYSAKKKADIVALITRPKGFFARLLTEENTKEIAHQLSRPLLILKE